MHLYRLPVSSNFWVWFLTRNSTQLSISFSYSLPIKIQRTSLSIWWLYSHFHDCRSHLDFSYPWIWKQVEVSCSIFQSICNKLLSRYSSCTRIFICNWNCSHRSKFLRCARNEYLQIFSVKDRGILLAVDMLHQSTGSQLLFSFWLSIVSAKS